MSWLTEALHGRKSLLQNLREELVGVAGTQVADVVEVAAGKVLHDGAVLVVDNAEKYKALILNATHAFLLTKLGPTFGGLAGQVADMAVGALVLAVTSAAHAVEGEPAP